jgi:hypothetical protein
LPATSISIFSAIAGGCGGSILFRCNHRRDHVDIADMRESKTLETGADIRVERPPQRWRASAARGVYYHFAAFLFVHDTALMKTAHLTST